MRDEFNEKFNKSITKPFTELEKQLLIAAEKGDAATVADLIKKGANVFVRSETPLLLSAENGHLEVVKLLVAEGSLGFARYDGPRFKAEWNGHTEVVKFLKQAQQDYRQRQWNNLPKP